MFLQIGKLVSGFVCLCIIASAAYCAPTISSHREIAGQNSTSLEESEGPAYPIVEGLFSTKNPLVELGSQFLAPPASTKGLTDDINVKSLPAVPAAVFMGICGFLCVSLVKDRRFWMAGFATVFWVGQMGISNLPRLAQRLAYSNKTNFGELTYTCMPDDTSRLRSSLDGTEYIGLLHHLGGIPANKYYHLSNHLFRSSAFGSSQHLSKQIGTNRRITLLAALYEQQSNFTSLFKCLVFNTRRYILFSPAFIFDSLSRGPPQSDLTSFHTIGV
jgi:hypothetical protein